MGRILFRCRGQKPSIFLADLARLLKSARTLLVKATKVILDIAYVEFEIVPDDIRVFPCRLRVARNKWSPRCEAGFSCYGTANKHRQSYSLAHSQAAQPEVL